MKSLILAVIFMVFMRLVVFSQDTLINIQGDTLIGIIQDIDEKSVFFVIEKNGLEFESRIDKKNIKTINYYGHEIIKTSGLDYYSVGFGYGMDFGGIGCNLLFYPQKNIGLFGGLGYAFAGTGFNVGTKLRFSSKYPNSSLIPNTFVMYGYNTAIAISNKPDLNKIFYGFTLGFGLDYKTNPSKDKLWTFAVLIPIRTADVQDYIDNLKSNFNIKLENELLPFGLAFGYRIVLK